MAALRARSASKKILIINIHEEVFHTFTRIKMAVPACSSGLCSLCLQQFTQFLLLVPKCCSYIYSAP